MLWVLAPWVSAGSADQKVRPGVAKEQKTAPPAWLVRSVQLCRKDPEDPSKGLR